MGFLTKVSIVKRLVACFGLLAIVILVVGGVNYQGMYYMNKETAKVISTAPLIDTSIKIKMEIQSQQMITMEMLGSHSREEIEPFWQEAKEHKTGLSANTDKLRGILGDKSTQFADDQALARLNKAVNDMQQLHDEQLFQKVEAIYQLVLADFINSAGSEKTLEDWFSAFTEFEDTIKNVKTDLTELAAASIATASYNEEYGRLQLLSEVVEQLHQTATRGKKRVLDSANSRSVERQNQLIPNYNTLMNEIKVQISALKSGKTVDDSVIPNAESIDIRAQAALWEKVLEEHLLPAGRRFSTSIGSI